MLRFELKTEYRGHEDDVRAIRVNPEKNTEFATVSRDKTLRIWTKDGDSTQSKIFTGHSSFVSCLYWAREGEIPHLKGSIVISGSRDCRLIVWNIEGECIHYELLGHTLDVTSVCVLRNGDIVSGSQDSNICVWRNGNLIKVIFLVYFFVLN
jgi:WD40 repeat protein